MPICLHASAYVCDTLTASLLSCHMYCPTGNSTVGKSSSQSSCEVKNVPTSAGQENPSDSGYGTAGRTKQKTGTSTYEHVLVLEVQYGCHYEVILFPSDLLSGHSVDYPVLPVEVATHSQSSADPTFAHTSVADAYKNEQYCMDHISRIPEPNTGETQFVVHYVTMSL